MAKKEIIGKREGEWSTESVVRIGGELYYRHENGGHRGSYNRQDGDGVWRESPVEPTRQITVSEARVLLLDWGCEDEAVALE